MADPVSLSLGVASILGPALHWTRLLLDTIQGASDAPAVLQALRDDLLSVNMTLESLQGVEDSEWALVGPNVVEQSKIIISTCTKSCTSLKSDLDHWTRHSNKGRLTWQDRMTMGLKQNRIKSMSEQLQRSKRDLVLVFSSATLSVSRTFLPFYRQSDNQPSYRSFRPTPAAPTIEDAISETQTDITNSIAATQRDLATVNTRLETLEATRRTANSSGSNGDDAEARIARDEEAAVKLSLSLLEGLRLSSQEAAKQNSQQNYHQSAPVTFGNNNSGWQLGANHGSISGITFGGRPT